MGTEKLSISLLKKWIGSIACPLFLWANNMTAEDYWQQIGRQEVAMFPEIYGKQTEQPCQCLSCGWVSTVWDCEGDVDGDGNLGCPECSKVVVVKV